MLFGLQRVYSLCWKQNWYERFDDCIWEKTKCKFVAKCLHRPRNSKTGNFTEWRERGRLGNVQNWKTPVRCVKNCCFSLYGCLIVLCRYLVVLAPWFIPDSQYHTLLLVSLLCKQILILSYFWFNKVIVDVVAGKSGAFFSPSWLNEPSTTNKEGTWQLLKTQQLGLL